MVPADCPHCGTSFKLKDGLAGKKVRCRSCHEVFRVPSPEAATEDETEYSAAGAALLRHQARERDFTLASGDERTIEAIGEHIAAHIGKVEMVFHELLSDLVHVDVHHVPPSRKRPFHTLVTSGMSDLPMTVPEGAEAFRFAELLLHLPPEWQLTQKDFENERWYWPVRWLKQLARLPHEYATWLGEGHTIPNGDPPEPFAPGTRLCCWLLVTPILAPEAFERLEIGADKIVWFWQLMPLYREEMEFKLDRGLEKLTKRFEMEEVLPIIDPKRPNVCKRRG